MNKGYFGHCFALLERRLFSESNISSAFNPEKVLAKIGFRSITPPQERDPTFSPKTPLSCRPIRQAGRRLREKSTNEPLDRILRGSERIAAMHECVQHDVRGQGPSP